MATPEGTNLERLQAVGLIRQDLPEDHMAVVDSLTDDEVETLVSVKKRLDEADESHGLPPVEAGELPGFATFVIF
jgi:hypothetical protein